MIKLNSSGARERAQLVKCLSDNHENPTIHIEKPGVVVCAYNLVPGGEDRGTSGFAVQLIWLSWWVLGSVRELVLKT